MSDLRTLILSAYETARQGYYRDALDEFRLILEHDRKNVEALYGAAACSFRLGEYEACLALVDRALRLHPRHSGALRLKEEARMKRLAEASAPTRVEAFHQPAAEPDAFGTGVTEARNEVIPEWAPVLFEKPSFSDMIREGEKIAPGRFRIWSVYRVAWRTYKSRFASLYLAGLISLLAEVGVVSILLAIWFLPLECLWLCVLVGLTLAAMLPLYACSVLEEGKVPLKRLAVGFLEQWVHLLLANFWMLLPFEIGLLSVRLGALELSAALGALGRSTVFLGAFMFCQTVLGWRCWFLNLVAGHATLRPVASVSKAFYGTKSQPVRVLIFMFLQLFLLPIGLLPAALGYPLVCLAQAEAYRQIYDR
jgi:hypothetical protein